MSLTSIIRTACGKDVKKIGFFGFGKSNKAIADILFRENPNYTFTYRSSEKSEIPQFFSKELRYNENKAFENITEDVIFMSPSVRRSSDFIASTKRAGCTLLSDAELFFLSEPRRVIAITGSDGKSTVTYLTAKLTEKTLSAPPSGNFGLPLVSLIANGECSGAVVELSSFQLQYMTPRVNRALITNISENHLNWHSDFNEYIQAKKNIFTNAKLRAITLDDTVCKKIAKEFQPDIIISSEHSALELNRLYKPEIAVTLENGSISVNGNPYIKTDDIFLKESYNIKNFMSAIALSFELTEKSNIISLAKTFHGLPHRKEFFAKHRGVSFINSSIDSTPSRTAKTLSTLDMPLVVIVGGSSKNLSYEPLIRALSESARAVVLTGETAPKLYELLNELKDFEPTVYYEPDFNSAVTLSAKIAKPGEAVILSPAHTSYDRFSNFEERGELFKNIINEITK